MAVMKVMMESRRDFPLISNDVGQGGPLCWARRTGAHSLRLQVAAEDDDGDDDDDDDE